MFTVAVPSNVPVLASEEQQRFAAEHQDVLPQAPPLQPTHVDVQCTCWTSFEILKIGRNFENGSKF